MQDLKTIAELFLFVEDMINNQIVWNKYDTSRFKKKRKNVKGHFFVTSVTVLLTSP